jgi:hypothetical protein
MEGSRFWQKNRGNATGSHGKAECLNPGMQHVFTASAITEAMTFTIALTLILLVSLCHGLCHAICLPLSLVV